LTGGLELKTTRTNADALDRMRSEGKDFFLLFTAKWCGYCAALKRELEAAPDDFLLYEIDISDEASHAWDEYGIRVVPTAIFFKGGKELSRRAASSSGLRVKDIMSLSSAP